MLFGIDIEYSRKQKGYFINQGDMDIMDFKRMMEAFDMFNSLNIAHIKSLPLQHTQQIIIDNEDVLQVKLKLYITHDFVMELLSFSDNMKVLKPASLANTLRDYHKKAYLQYK